MTAFGLNRQALNAITPADRLATVTKSDTVDITPPGDRTFCKGLWVGTGGDLYVDNGNETNILIENVGSGVYVPISVTRVRNATTASNIVALY